MDGLWLLWCYDVHLGGINVAKSIFKILTGIDVGPVRLPLRHLTSAEYDAMKKAFEETGLISISQPREQ